MALEDGDTSLDKRVEAALEADGVITPKTEIDHTPDSIDAFNDPNTVRDQINLGLQGADGGIADGAVAGGGQKQKEAEKKKERAKDQITQQLVLSALSAEQQEQVDNFADKLLDYLTGELGYSLEEVQDMNQREMIRIINSSDDLSKRFDILNENNPEIAKLPEHVIKSVKARVAEDHELSLRQQQEGKHLVSASSGIVSMGIAQSSMQNDAEPPRPEQAPSEKPPSEQFIETLQEAIGANGYKGSEIRDTQDKLQETIDDLANSEWAYHPDIQYEISSLKQEIIALDQTFDQLTNMNDFFDKLMDFTEEHKEKIDAGAPLDEMITLALQNDELKDSYFKAIDGLSYEERLTALQHMADKFNVPTDVIENALNTQIKHIEEPIIELSTITGFAADVYNYGMSWFSQPTDDTAADSAQIISDQQAQIDALTAQRDAFTDKINEMDTMGSIMNHYFSEVEQLDEQIDTMQTQLNKFVELHEQVQAMREFKADVDYHAENNIPHHFSPEKAAEMLAQMEADIQKLQDEIINEQQEKIAEATEELAQAETTQRKATAELADIEQELTALQTGGFSPKPGVTATTEPLSITEQIASISSPTPLTSEAMSTRPEIQAGGMSTMTTESKIMYTELRKDSLEDTLQTVESVAEDAQRKIAEAEEILETIQDIVTDDAPAPKPDAAQLLVDNNTELKSYISSLGELTNIPEAELHARLEELGVPAGQIEQVANIAHQQYSANITPLMATTEISNNEFTQNRSANKGPGELLQGTFAANAAPSTTPLQSTPAPDLLAQSKPNDPENNATIGAMSMGA